METPPVAVTAVEWLGAATWGVTLCLSDGRTVYYVIPESIANLTGVQISAAAVAALTGPPPAPVTHPHRVHRRYDPRTP